MSYKNLNNNVNFLEAYKYNRSIEITLITNGTRLGVRADQINTCPVFMSRKYIIRMKYFRNFVNNSLCQ